MTMQKKIAALILLAGIIPLLIIVGAARYMAHDSLVDGTMNQMERVRTAKISAVESYFNQRKNDLAKLTKAVGKMQNTAKVSLEKIRDTNQRAVSGYLDRRIKDVAKLATNESLGQSMATIDWVFRQADKKAGGEKWTLIVDKQTPWLEKFQAEHGFEDLYLISLRGDVFYTATRGSELGSNVKNQQTSLGQLLDKAKKQLSVQDHILKQKSSADAKIYIGAPVKLKGNIIGIVAVSIATKKMFTPLLSKNGLGKSGKVYLVGQDRTLRANIGTGSIKDEFINQEAAKQALAGHSGAGLISNNGLLRLAAWQPLLVGKNRWALITESDLVEGVGSSANSELGQKYLDKSGYYDLFLIKPNGLVFHTAARQKDYGTNLITGPYSDSNLTHLLRSVVKTKKPGMTDVLPYAPSNGEPAAFIAAPIISSGVVEMVVALQLPLEGLTQILTPGDSLGSNGDIYLVGPDKRMRSDSYTRPESHSVFASFNGSLENNGMDIEAVTAALAGNSGTLADESNSTFYAYAPISFESFTWALVLESGTTSGGGLLAELINTLTLISFALIPLVLLLALAGAKNTVNPLTPFTELIDQLAQGNFAATLQQGQKSSMGNLANQVIEMTERIGQMTINVRKAAMAMIKQGQELAKTAQNQAQAQPQLQPASEAAAPTIDFSKITAAITNIESSLAGETRQALISEQSVELTSMDIAESNQSINEAISASREVSERIFVIEEQTRQLRLLAMNAAIEAARSGGPGEAFVTSAKEMRKLAEQSRIGASEIHRLSTSNTRGATLAGEKLTNLAQTIRKSIELIQEQSETRAEQRETLNSLIAELKQLTSTGQPASPETKPEKTPIPVLAVDKEVAKFKQKSELLLDALAFFITPNDKGER
ncbi:MAG: methyl-accepting chemotaxis protein [Magnetococcales bacterium]|nr:methyl-accepting chemotaxis protein [Magnetococcales bacterium]